MGHIKEPKGVDFVVKSEPLTTADRKMISEYISKYKQKVSTASKVVKKEIKSKKAAVVS